MGIRIQVGDYTFQAIDYQVTEAASPLSSDDSTGQVGSISFTIPRPDPDAFTNIPTESDFEFGEDDFGEGVFGGVIPLSQQLTGWKLLLGPGPGALIDLPVRLEDSYKGFTVGTVYGYSMNAGTITIECSSRLGSLNVYGVQAQPFIGRLDDAFEYYLSLAGVTTGLFVDNSIAARPVVFPGWSGELWYYLKRMASALDCDISLVSGNILLRPIRVRVATRGRDIDRSKNVSPPSLAQSIEMYQYNNTPITNKLVFPPGGWEPEQSVYNVNAGETASYTLILSSSLSSFVPPTHVTSVSQLESSLSVYTTIANDDTVVSPADWIRYGGRVELVLNPNTTSMTLTLTGPEGYVNSSGDVSSNFSLALISPDTGTRYSTLRILGTGVAFNKEKKTIPTAVPAALAPTEVGTTIDNPFISTTDDLYRAGTRVAKNYSGQVSDISGTVTAINQRGDSGQATYPTYGEVETELKAVLGTPTYAQVQTYYLGPLDLDNYGDVQSYWFTFVQDDFTNQVLGNINGARIYDRGTRRWYRIREATSKAGNITFRADDDLTNHDMEQFHASRTYGDVQLILGDLSYRQADLAGLYGG